MSDDQPDTAPAVPTDADRLRRIWRIVLIGGVGLGPALALLSGLLGGTGSGGLAIVLLLLAASSGSAALYATITAVIDDLKGREVSRQRILTAAGLFVAGALLPLMLVGVGG